MPDDKNFYSVYLIRDGKESEELGTIPNSSDLSQWLPMALKLGLIPYLADYRDEFRVKDSESGEVKATYRLGWIEVEPVEEKKRSILQ